MLQFSVHNHSIGGHMKPRPSSTLLSRRGFLRATGSNHMPVYTCVRGIHRYEGLPVFSVPRGNEGVFIRR